MPQYSIDGANRPPKSNKVNRTLRQEVYVAKTGSDDTGDGSEAAPYLTIQKAVNSIGLTLDVPVTLHIAAGTYDEEVYIADIAGGMLKIIGDQNEDGTPATHVATMFMQYCNSKIAMTNMEFYTNTSYYATVFISNCTSVILENVVCKTEGGAVADDNGAVFASETPLVFLYSCTISNRSVGVQAIASIVYLNSGTTGENNTISLLSGSGNGSAGAIIFKGSSTIAGATEVKEYGGQIF